MSTRVAQKARLRQNGGMYGQTDDNPSLWSCTHRISTRIQDGLRDLESTRRAWPANPFPVRLAASREPGDPEDGPRGDRVLGRASGEASRSWCVQARWCNSPRAVARRGGDVGGMGLSARDVVGVARWTGDATRWEGDMLSYRSRTGRRSGLHSDPWSARPGRRRRRRRPVPSKESAPSATPPTVVEASGSGHRAGGRHKRARDPRVVFLRQRHRERVDRAPCPVIRWRKGCPGGPVIVKSRCTPPPPHPTPAPTPPRARARFVSNFTD